MTVPSSFVVMVPAINRDDHQASSPLPLQLAPDNAQTRLTIAIFVKQREGLLEPAYESNSG